SVETTHNLLSWSISFFFQAEDGIRDGHVTGVQTCALPISEPARRLSIAPTPARRAVPAWKRSLLWLGQGRRRHREWRPRALQQLHRQRRRWKRLVCKFARDRTVAG